MNHSVIYASSYDRGLTTLLEIWPAVRALVPDATLDIFYGWDSFDAVHKQNPEMMKFKWQIIRKLHELKGQGVTEHGRLDHQALAKEFKKHKVWAYPTEFTEIHCITALKAQEAGCIPVTTGCYALKETVQNNVYTVECEDISTNTDMQDKFIKNVAAALLGDYQVEPVKGVSWKEVAKVWQSNLAS